MGSCSTARALATAAVAAVPAAAAVELRSRRQEGAGPAAHRAPWCTVPPCAFPCAATTPSRCPRRCTADPEGLSRRRRLRQRRQERLRGTRRWPLAAAAATPLSQAGTPHLRLDAGAGALPRLHGSCCSARTSPSRTPPPRHLTRTRTRLARLTCLACRSCPVLLAAAPLIPYFPRPLTSPQPAQPAELC